MADIRRESSGSWLSLSARDAVVDSTTVFLLYQRVIYLQEVMFPIPSSAMLADWIVVLSGLTGTGDGRWLGVSKYL
jgi:hypothetical protein